MEREARRELERLATAGLDAFRDSLWLAALAYLADACAALGDERMAALVYPEFEPLAGGNVMIGHLVACYGAADRYLGHARGDAGRGGAGRGALRAGLELNRRMGADLGRPHRLRVRPLCSPAAPGGRARAEALLGEAAALAERIGMEALRARCAASASPLPRRASGRALAARGADPRAGRAGAEQPRDRRGAVDQRAHRGEPHPQHPAQDAAAPIAPRPPPTPTVTASSP